MTSERQPPRKELSDSEGLDLAYALLMDAIGSMDPTDKDSDVKRLTLAAKTTFQRFGIPLDKKDMEQIKPALEKMLALAKERGLLGKLEHMVDHSRQTTGAVHESLGTTMQSRRTPGAVELGTRALLTIKGTAELGVDLAKAVLTILDVIAKKLNFSVGGKHVHLSSSRRDVVLAGMFSKLNTQSTVSSLNGKAKADARRINFTGGALIHAARINRRNQNKASSSLPSH